MTMERTLKSGGRNRFRIVQVQCVCKSSLTTGSPMDSSLPRSRSKTLVNSKAGPSSKAVLNSPLVRLHQSLSKLRELRLLSQREQQLHLLSSGERVLSLSKLALWLGRALP